MKQYQLNVTFGFNSMQEFKDFEEKFADVPAKINDWGLIEVSEE